MRATPSRMNQCLVQSLYNFFLNGVRNGEHDNRIFVISIRWKINILKDEEYANKIMGDICMTLCFITSNNRQ